MQEFDQSKFRFDCHLKKLIIKYYESNLIMRRVWYPFR